MLLILVLYNQEYQIFHERRRSVLTQVTGLFYFNENTNMTWQLNLSRIFLLQRLSNHYLQLYLQRYLWIT